MYLFEDRYSINYIYTKYGIYDSLLSKLWLFYIKKKEELLFIVKCILPTTQLLDIKFYWILETMIYLLCRPR